MHLLRPDPQHALPLLLVDDADVPVPDVTDFLHSLHARGYSPNTLRAYAYDLQYFYQFLALQGLTPAAFTPARSLELLEYLQHIPSQRRGRTHRPILVDPDGHHPLSPASINRIFAAISSLYEFLILADRLPERENPMIKIVDDASARVSDRYRPFLDRIHRQRPLRRIVRVKMVQRLPRPLSDDQVTALLQSLRSWRDRAMCWLMVQGGLRPGEVLNLHLEDIQYGRRRVVIRHRTDHPRGVRTKSRHERVVDLHEPEALGALSQYVMTERPPEAATSHVFLVGGRGQRRLTPLSYHALVKLFARHCHKLGMREPWMTPHALRHTHATRMWEGGMRELALQKRLGHASPESTRIYTRVSDPQMVAEYRQALGKEDTH